MRKEGNSWCSDPVSPLDADVQRRIKNKDHMAKGALALTPILASIAVISTKALLGSKYQIVGQNEAWKPLEDPDILAVICFLSSAAATATGFLAPHYRKAHRLARTEYKEAIEKAKVDNGVDTHLLETRLRPIQSRLLLDHYS